MTINDLNTEISRYKVQTTTDKEEIKKLSEKVFGLDSKIKEVLSFTRASSETIIKDKLIPYLIEKHDTVELTKIDSICSSDSFIRVPKIAQWYDSGAYIKISVLKSGVKIDSLSIKDSLYMRVVKTKSGIFKKKYTVEVKRSSPYVKTNNVESIILTQKTPPSKILGAILIPASLLYLIFTL